MSAIFGPLCGVVMVVIEIEMIVLSTWVTYHAIRNKEPYVVYKIKRKYNIAFWIFMSILVLLFIYSHKHYEAFGLLVDALRAS